MHGRHRMQPLLHSRYPCFYTLALWLPGCPGPWWHYCSKKTSPNFPYISRWHYVASLAMKKALACIDRLIDVTSEWGAHCQFSTSKGCRKWAFTPSAAVVLQKLITDPDSSRVITALRPLNITGKLTNENRIEMIRRFNECLVLPLR